MGNQASADDESFSDGLLEYPHYTRPAEFRGWPVPEVLRTGDHGRIARWRRAQALHRTLERRPDLIEGRGGLSDDERALLAEHDLPVPVGPVEPVGPAEAVGPVEPFRPAEPG
jgi:tRNA (guanine37-N1)-methyltransferase